MRLFAKSVGIGAVSLLAIQFIPAHRYNPAVKGDLVARPTVKGALQNACYDCHSNQTRWPWYSAVAPASWKIARDVNDGRRRLNFSAWDDYASDPETARRKLNEIARFVASGDMAPWYYRALHPDARLSDLQRRLIVSWAREQASRTSE